MRHLTIDVSNYDSRLHIGKQGENLTREITFDCASWLDGSTGGVLSIVHQRPSDPDAYPCGDYVTDDTSLTWSINETDVAFSGLGKCEIRYTIGSRIAKTKTFYTEIVNALNPLDTPPDAYEPYIDRVIDAATQEMENMTVSATATSGEQTSVDVTKTRENDHEHIAFNFTVEKGDKGEKGEDGKSIVNVTASIDANVGTPSVTVTTSSSDAGLSVDLDFHNMKGIPGASFDTSYLPSDTASGSPATFTDGAKNVPVDELVTTIVSDPGGEGWTQAKILSCGKNLFSLGDQGGERRTDYLYFPVPLPPGDYTISAIVTSTDTDSNISMVEFRYEDDTSQYVQLSRGTRSSYPRTLSKRVAAIRFYASNNNVNSAGDTFLYKDIQLELGLSETIYEAYNGVVTTISFGRTVFNGSLNVTTGVLTIDDDQSTVQLTPVEVDTLLGANFIISNCGVVSVRYRADIGLYIDKKLS